MYAKKNASFNFQTSVATLLKKCYLRNVQTNYNPATMAMYDDGNFQEIDLAKWKTSNGDIVSEIQSSDLVPCT